MGDMSRREMFVKTYQMSRQSDPKLGVYSIGAFVVGALVGFALMWVLPGGGWISVVLGVVVALLLGLLAALVVFNQRARKAMYAQAEGRPGASLGALAQLRRGWNVEQTPIAFTRQQDVIFRVVGPPGIILVADGNAGRLRQLLLSEKRRHERVALDTPVHEITVGNDPGQVPLSKLVTHLNKMPRAVKPAEMTEILSRLRALTAQRGTMPVPKGPLPTSTKGLRGQQRGR